MFFLVILSDSKLPGDSALEYLREVVFRPSWPLEVSIGGFRLAYIRRLMGLLDVNVM